MSLHDQIIGSAAVATMGVAMLAVAIRYHIIEAKQGFPENTRKSVDLLFVLSTELIAQFFFFYYLPHV